MKKCSRCGKTKPLSAFHKFGSKRYTHRPDCKDCRNKAERDRVSREKREALLDELTEITKGVIGKYHGEDTQAFENRGLRGSGEVARVVKVGRPEA